MEMLIPAVCTNEQLVIIRLWKVFQFILIQTLFVHLSSCSQKASLSRLALRFLQKSDCRDAESERDLRRPGQQKAAPSLRCGITVNRSEPALEPQRPNRTGFCSRTQPPSEQNANHAKRIFWTSSGKLKLESASSNIYHRRRKLCNTSGCF